MNYLNILKNILFFSIFSPILFYYTLFCKNKTPILKFWLIHNFLFKIIFSFGQMKHFLQLLCVGVHSCVWCILPEFGLRLSVCLEIWVRRIFLSLAFSIPASFSSPSVAFSKPCMKTVRCHKNYLGDWGLYGFGSKWVASKMFAYLQTIKFILQCFGVLGQAKLLKPPCDGTIIHA